MSTIIFRDYNPDNPWQVTGETKTITNNFIVLDYAPLNGSLTISGFTPTSDKSSIGLSEFYIDYGVSSAYKAADQKVYFNSAKNGITVTCTYQGVSQTLFAVYLNSLFAHTNDPTMHTPSPASTGFLKTSTGSAPVWANIKWSDIQEKPNFADASWKAPVATPASLPLTGNTIGDLRLVINDGDADGAIYSCIATTGLLAAQWEKISDVNFATPAWSAITGKPSTLTGYGITDALASGSASSTPTANKLLYLNSSAQFSGSVLTDSTVTDSKIGNRTVSQSLAAPASTGTITNILSWIAGRIKAITGSSNWYDEPPTNLTVLKAHADATSDIHGAVTANTPSTIVMRNDIGQIFANGVCLNTTAAQLEMGSTTASSSPYIDFHSSGSTNDYDARIMATGGTSGASGRGSMFMYSPKVYVTSSAQPTTFCVNADEGYASYIIYSKGNLFRWRSGADSATESGSSVGSDYYLSRYNDAGTFVGAPFSIKRDTGKIYVGDSTGATPIQLQISDSAHATSRRAGLGLGSSWSITQDSAGNGTMDFSINSVANSQNVFKISADATTATLYNSRASNMQLVLSTATGQFGYIGFSTNNVRRWDIGSNSDPESGGNLGSNYYMSRFSDGGNYLGSPFGINRATGQITLGDSTLPYAEQLYLKESAHATSKRTAIRFGTNWLMSQDTSGNGTKNFGLYNVTSGTLPFSISADGTNVSLQNTLSSSDMVLSIDSNVAKSSALSLKKGGAARWSFCCDSTTESGANVGSNLYLTAATDAGAYLRTSLYIYRTGKIQFNSGTEDFLINSSKALTDARLPRTLTIPGGVDYASGRLYLPDGGTLASIKIQTHGNTGANVTPSASTTILINKVVGTTHTTIATISAITTATTTYDVSPDVAIEAGAFVYAKFSGSNNGVDVASVVLILA